MLIASVHYPCSLTCNCFLLLSPVGPIVALHLRLPAEIAPGMWEMLFGSWHLVLPTTWQATGLSSPTRCLWATRLSKQGTARRCKVCGTESVKMESSGATWCLVCVCPWTLYEPGVDCVHWRLCSNCWNWWLCMLHEQDQWWGLSSVNPILHLIKVWGTLSESSAELSA